MSAIAVHQVTSEVAYDLMQDHLDTILALLNGAMSRDEVVARLGSATTLERLVRHGLVSVEGDTLRAVSSAYQQLRQEGMISFLERYVLPSLTATTQDDGLSSLVNLHLNLTEEQMRGLRPGPVQSFFETITAISDQPATGPTSRFTVMVVGTSRLITEAVDEDDRALRHTQQAALQRATPEERDLAVLSQWDALADNARFKLSLPELERLVESMKQFEASSVEHANYHLTVASHWQSANASVAQESEVRRKPC